MLSYYSIQNLPKGVPSIDDKRFFVIDNTSSTLTAVAEQISRLVGSLQLESPSNLLTDFPLINKRFNLPYSGHDL